MRMEICQFILPLSCLLLLTTTRALDINYPLSPVCAVTGSTVVIPCEFAYPQSLRVETFMWCHNDVHCEQPTHVCHSDNTNINADYWGRAECLGDRVKNCALKIKDIKDTDAGVYQFGFTSSYVTGISVGWPGVTLQVCELKVMVTRSKGVREGDSVILTCDTESCSLSQSEFTWFKDDQPMTETKSTLHFSPVCKYHSGKYSCALKDSKVSNKMDLIVQGGAWTVDYPEETQCAVRRSTEVFQCGRLNYCVTEEVTEEELNRAVILILTIIHMQLKILQPVTETLHVRSIDIPISDQLLLQNIGYVCNKLPYKIVLA
nr:sialoadhesin-like isoform X3 [Paramormyrops kingsleyae]